MEVDDKSNLSPDEGERKRKVDKQEEKPAKHKSVEYKAGDATVKVGQDKTTIESVSPPRAPASPDHNGETEEKSVGLANGDATAASINVSNVPQPYQEDDGQPEVDKDHGNSENDADSEKKAAGTHKTSKSDNETTSEKEKDAKKDKESHKDPKKKHQASEKREGAMNDLKPDDQKNANTEENQLEENLKSDIKKNSGHDTSSVEDVMGNSKKEDKRKEYFPSYKGKKMTVVFHAVLAPHFKFEKSQGDRLYMRFGEPALGDFQEDVVEVFPQRYLDDGFILVKAELSVPHVFLARKIPYKYIVFKAKRKDSKEKKKYLWEQLLDLGTMTNRCLHIPQDRCREGAFWHQYDDTIFSSPSWWQSIRSKLPIVKSMDSTEGRNIATRVMLPKWEGFTVNDVKENITAWEAIQTINDIAYCYTQTEAMEKRRTTKNVPHRYDFQQILKEFFKTRIETKDRKSVV